MKLDDESLSKADMAYVPAGTQVKISAEKCLVLVIIS